MLKNMARNSSRSKEGVEAGNQSRVP